MEIKILGSGNLNPSLERGSPAYLISTKSLKILVDIGPATIRRIVEYGFSLNEIDVIVLTHFHIDHSADLSSFLFAANYGVEERTRPLTVIGGPGMHKFFRGLRAVYPWISPKSYKLAVKSLPKGEMQLQGVTIRTGRANHNPESIALRFEEGKSSAVFSGDTDYAKGVVRLAHKTDLLVIDCACPEKKMKGHLNLAGIERVLSEAKPARVILSHLYPDWDGFDAPLKRPFLLAEDGLTINLP